MYVEKCHAPDAEKLSTYSAQKPIFCVHINCWAMSCVIRYLNVIEIGLTVNQTMMGRWFWIKNYSVIFKINQWRICPYILSVHFYKKKMPTLTELICCYDYNWNCNFAVFSVFNLNFSSFHEWTFFEAISNPIKTNVKVMYCTSFTYSIYSRP